MAATEEAVMAAICGRRFGCIVTGRSTYLGPPLLPVSSPCTVFSQ